jgi:hypothetical protein
MCINNKSAVVNNYFGKLQDFILLLTIPMGKRKDFFEIYIQLGTRPQKVRQPWFRVTAVKTQNEFLRYNNTR